MMEQQKIIDAIRVLNETLEALKNYPVNDSILLDITEKILYLSNNLIKMHK